MTTKQEGNWFARLIRSEQSKLQPKSILKRKYAAASNDCSRSKKKKVRFAAAPQKPAFSRVTTHSSQQRTRPVNWFFRHTSSDDTSKSTTEITTSYIEIDLPKTTLVEEVTTSTKTEKNNVTSVEQVVKTSQYASEHTQPTEQVSSFLFNSF